MNLIDLKERIAISTDYTPQERDFLLDAINAKGGERRAVELHDPGNYLGRIETLWAVFSIDDGGEGIVAAPFGALTLPLIAADKRRLEQIVPVARAVARKFSKPCRLVKFTKREDVEVYLP